MVVAIVAIPAADEPVWKVSSEKIPHLTLLALGDSVEDPEGISQYVQHVAEHSATRFGLPVDHRGVLGDKNADVLFFEKEGGYFERARALRDNLLRNNDILQAYLNSPQFESWTPHLTLGYPDSPAIEPKDQYYLNWIRFDRLAIWFGDFSGPEFLLPQDIRDVLHMDAEVEAFLEHHGIKGMKWGIRRTDAQLGNPDGGKNGVKDKDGIDENKSKMAKGSGSHPADKPDLEIDNPRDVKISEDAIRFVRTRLKEGHEMSDREIVEAINRARNVEQYQKMFMPDPNKELKARLEQLETQKKIGELEAELSPSQKTAAQRLVSASKGAFSAYQAVDGVLGGAISNKLKDAIGDALTDPAAKALAKKVEDEKEAARSRSEKRKEQLEDLKIAKAKAELTTAQNKNRQEKRDLKAREASSNKKDKAAREAKAEKEAADKADRNVKYLTGRAKDAHDAVVRYQKAADQAESRAAAARKIRDDPNASPAARARAAFDADRYSSQASSNRGQARVAEAARTKLQTDVSEAHRRLRALQHSDELENFLMHYGVKGMRWGVHRDLDQSVGSTSVKTLKTKSDNSQKAVAKPSALKEAFNFPGSSVKRELAYGSAAAGATALATMLAGPIGGIPVAALARTLNSHRIIKDREKVGSDKYMNSLKLTRNASIPVAATVVAKNGEALTENFKFTKIGQLFPENRAIWGNTKPGTVDVNGTLSDILNGR